MEIQIQDLITSIKTDGIEKAKAETAEIISKAKAEADGMAEKLDAMRREYSSADARTQRRTAPVIVKAERQLEKLREYIREAEKEIRNTENMLINNGR